ncbi:hypothetical protein ACED51_16890 [Photobacterium swingsii]|uniref:hypothetical protein n=1 Tax=Photobacterium swingsii TaxID=680026 RepID=UPI00352F7EBD
MENSVIDYSNDILSLRDVNERCENHIIQFYSIGKQLTVERTGTTEDKTVMYKFIDECRTWANSVHPKSHELHEIKPIRNDHQ